MNDRKTRYRHVFLLHNLDRHSVSVSTHIYLIMDFVRLKLTRFNYSEHLPETHVFYQTIEKTPQTNLRCFFICIVRT